GRAAGEARGSRPLARRSGELRPRPQDLSRRARLRLLGARGEIARRWRPDRRDLLDRRRRGEPRLRRQSSQTNTAPTAAIPATKWPASIRNSLSDLRAKR